MVATVKGLKNAGQAATYFGHDPRQARPEQADYYTEGREGPSQWSGQLAERLGLSGEVASRDLHRMMAGQIAGEDLATHGGKSRSPGIDLCLQAPKSVSIAALYLGDERVTAAHRAAVSETLAVLEREACARMTQNGRTEQVRTGQLLIAQAEHCTVRASESAQKRGASVELDGHLHTHNVIVNVTAMPDGSFRALDSRFLFQQQLRAGALYHSALAENLRAAGYTPVFRKDGTFDLAEISAELIDATSRRRAEILAAAGEGASAAQRDAANQKTRAAKSDTLDIATLREQWRSAGREAMPDWTPPEGDGVIRSADERNAEAIAWVRDHLFERSSAVSADEFERVALANGADPRTIRDAMAAHPDLRHGGDIEIRDSRNRKRIVPAVVSREALDRERKIVALASKGRGAAAPIDPDVDAVAARMAAADAEGRRLNSEQQAVATAILTTDSRFLAIQGVAGAGKTFTMAKAFDEARTAGYSVLGLAPTNKAAGELRAATGEGATLASFLASDRELGARSIIVLDEAGMVSTKDMHALMRRIDRAGARLVMVGDTAQLKSVAAGDPFGLMQRAQCLQVGTLTQSSRAKSEDMKAVYATVFSGDTDAALDRLRSEVIKDDGARHAAIAARYCTLSEAERNETLILVGTNGARQAINDHVRHAEGLTGQGIALDTLIAADATDAELRKIDTYQVGQIVQAGDAIVSPDLQLQSRRGEQWSITAVDHKARTLALQHIHDPARRISVPVGEGAPQLMLFERERLELAQGDRVLLRENRKGDGVFNGDRGRVVAIDRDRQCATIEIGTGKAAKRLTIDNRGDRLPMLQHGYAMTVHASQGATVDRVLTDLSADRTTNKNLLLVAVTRARHEAEVWTRDAEASRAAVKDAAIKHNAAEVLAARLDTHAHPFNHPPQHDDKEPRMKADTPEKQAVWDRENREREEAWKKENRDRDAAWKKENQEREDAWKKQDLQQRDASRSRDNGQTPARDPAQVESPEVVGQRDPAAQDARASQRAQPESERAVERQRHAGNTAGETLRPEVQRSGLWLDADTQLTRAGNVFYKGDYDADRTRQLRDADPERYQRLVVEAGGVIDRAGNPCDFVDGEPRPSREARELQAVERAQARTAGAALDGEILAEGPTRDGRTVELRQHGDDHALVERDGEGQVQQATELQPEEAREIVERFRRDPEQSGPDEGERLQSHAEAVIADGDQGRAEQDDRPRATLDRADVAQQQEERSRTIGAATEAPERAVGQEQAQEQAGDARLKSSLDQLAAQHHQQYEQERGYSR